MHPSITAEQARGGGAGSVHGCVAEPAIRRLPLLAIKGFKAAAATSVASGERDDRVVYEIIGLVV